MIPPILVKAKRASFWLWLGFAVSMVAALVARHMGWDTLDVISSGVMLLFAASFGACVVLMGLFIMVAIFKFLVSSNRDV